MKKKSILLPLTKYKSKNKQSSQPSEGRCTQLASKIFSKREKVKFSFVQNCIGKKPAIAVQNYMALIVRPKFSY